MVQGQNLAAARMHQWCACSEEGELHKTDSKDVQARRWIEDIFINRGLPLNFKCAISLKETCDNGDSCSLVLDGRLIVPTEVKESDFVFKNTPHMHVRTDMAEMLPGSKMKAIEDVSAGAVLVATDLDGTVKGKQKHARLGRDAVEKILEAATQDIIRPARAS